MLSYNNLGGLNMNKFWLLAALIALVILLLPAQAQEAAPAVAPTEQRPPDRAAVEPQLPSRANNWNLPTIVH